MKKYNVQNYIRYKEDLDITLNRIPDRRHLKTIQGMR